MRHTCAAGSRYLLRLGPAETPEAAGAVRKQLQGRDDEDRGRNKFVHGAADTAHMYSRAWVVCAHGIRCDTGRRVYREDTRSLLTFAVASNTMFHAEWSA